MISTILSQGGDWLPDLVSGLKVSVMVTMVSLLIGLPFGFLLSLGRDVEITHVQCAGAGGG